MIATPPTLVPALAAIERALDTVRQRRGVDGTRGLAPGLLVPTVAEPLGVSSLAAGIGRTTAAGSGWFPATSLVAGNDELDQLLAAAGKRWQASPHAAAALAWRSYTHWLAMPVVLGWATAARVPLVDPADVLVQLDGGRQLLRLGLRRLRLVVLDTDPLAGSSDHSIEVIPVGSPQASLAALRQTLRGAHLDPLAGALQRRVRLGDRTLLGSLAAAVAYAVVRGVDAPPPEQVATAGELLAALGVADLVSLEPTPQGPQVRRRTCCLAFTLPQPKLCASCCLHPTAS